MQLRVARQTWCSPGRGVATAAFRRPVGTIDPNSQRCRDKGSFLASSGKIDGLRPK
jgi:hypothetical protein